MHTQKVYNALEVHEHYINWGFAEVGAGGEVLNEVEFSCNKVSAMYKYCQNNFGEDVARTFLTESLRVKFSNLAYHLRTLQGVKPEHFRGMAKVEAIALLLRFAGVLQNCNLEQCCKTIINIESEMYQALPPDNARSHKSCNEAVSDMVNFAKRWMEKVKARK